MTDSKRRQFELESKLRGRLLDASTAERPALYEEVYSELGVWLEEEGLVQGTDEHSAELQLELLRPLVDGHSTVVEFGGGDGALAGLLAPLVADMVVVDIGRAGKASGAAGAPRRVVPQGLEVDLPDACADLVYSCHFVEHLHAEDLEVHLKEATRLLRAGGALVVVTPNHVLGPHDVSRDFAAEPAGLHLVEYTFGSLSRQLRRAGFSSVRAVRGFGSDLRLVPLARYEVAERLLGLVPRSLRDLSIRLVAPRCRAPLRPLEQVKLHAVR